MGLLQKRLEEMKLEARRDDLGTIVPSEIRQLIGEVLEIRQLMRSTNRTLPIDDERVISHKEPMLFDFMMIDGEIWQISED